jgi:enoyl-CoA hydratase/3-hydroxyacyl-CoA dehydrogenase
VSLTGARRLAGLAPLAVQKIKQVSDVAGLGDGIEAEKEAFAEIFATDDATEGVQAFLDKRDARWTGK